MSKENKEEEERLKNFLKDAFCIDGECETIGVSFTIFKDSSIRAQQGMSFRLTDSERGEFYVSLGNFEPNGKDLGELKVE